VQQNLRYLIATAYDHVGAMPINSLANVLAFSGPPPAKR
jgi:hypothetical protein